MSVVRGRKGGEWEGLAQPLACVQLKPGQRQSQWLKADGGRLMWILDFGKIKPDCMDEAATADESEAFYTRPDAAGRATNTSKYMP